MSSVVPFHVAIIPDGNRRAAEKLGLPRSEGHVKGAEALHVVVDALRAAGVKIVTAWTFSTDNWNRSKEEVDRLLALLKRYLKEEGAKFVKEKVRFRVLGDESRFDNETQKLMSKLEADTAGFSDFTFNMALNYGGRDEIVRTVKKIIAAGHRESEIDYALIASYLDTAGQPDPDLIIRTSGEQRLSGFMPLQGALAELYFAPFNFPDFTKEKVDEILAAFAARERRFGK